MSIVVIGLLLYQQVLLASVFPMWNQGATVVAMNWKYQPGEKSYCFGFYACQQLICDTLLNRTFAGVLVEAASPDICNSIKSVNSYGLPWKWVIVICDVLVIVASLWRRKPYSVIMTTAAYVIWWCYLYKIVVVFGERPPILVIFGTIGVGLGGVLTVMGLI